MSGITKLAAYASRSPSHLNGKLSKACEKVWKSRHDFLPWKGRNSISFNFKSNFMIKYQCNVIPKDQILNSISWPLKYEISYQCYIDTACKLNNYKKTKKGLNKYSVCSSTEETETCRVTKQPGCSQCECTITCRSSNKDRSWIRFMFHQITSLILTSVSEGLQQSDLCCI